MSISSCHSNDNTIYHEMPTNDKDTIYKETDDSLQPRCRRPSTFLLSHIAQRHRKNNPQTHQALCHRLLKESNQTQFSSSIRPIHSNPTISIEWCEHFYLNPPIAHHCSCFSTHLMYTNPADTLSTAQSYIPSTTKKFSRSSHPSPIPLRSCRRTPLLIPSRLQPPQ